MNNVAIAPKALGRPAWRWMIALLLSCAAAQAAMADAPATGHHRLDVNSPVGELLDNAAALAILKTYAPILANSPQISAARALPLRSLAQYAPTILTPGVLERIGQALAVAPEAFATGLPGKPPELIDPAAALTLKTVPLWTGKAPGALGERPLDRPTLTIVPTGETTSFGSAVIVAPGGGYQTLATGLEGRQVADWFAAHGVTAFVLTYRLSSSGYVHPTQLQDAQRAIRWVRAHAAEFGISPERIGMIGFSAGGHLTAMAETQFDKGNSTAPDPIDRESSRPDFAILSYAAIELADNKWNSRVLIGAGTPKDSMDQIQPARHIRPDTPPTFLWATTTDELVPASNSTLMYNALIAGHVPAELHIFSHGRHGMGLGMTDPTLSLWPMLLQNWLEGLGVIGARTLPQR